MRHILFIICLTLGSFALSQQDTAPDFYDDSSIEKQAISETDLEDYKNNDAFNYTEIEEETTIIDKIKRWLNNILRKFWEAIFGVGSADGFLFFIFRILPYLLLGLLFYLLIRFFLKVNSKNIITKAKAKGSILYSEEEQIIKNEDINALIQQAVEQKNYRLAIRYYYLLALKKLSETETIEWEAQKTNGDYINELGKSPLKFDFENITKIYDYVWYGEFDVDAMRFENLKLPFESLNKAIKHG